MATYIKPEAIKDGTISASKTDETIATKSYVDTQIRATNDKVDDFINAGYLYAGIATPEINPGTIEVKVFYIANGKGTYPNFGGLEVTEDEVVVLYYDTEWHKVVTGIASKEKLIELSAEVSKKQNTITDLADIRSGAAKGATAIQEVKTINGQSIVGSGNIEIQGGGGGASSDKQGVIRQTQTWTQAADKGYDYVMSNLVRGAIPQANIDLFTSAGAVFNEESGYFELNGLTDISYEEMINIHNYTIPFSVGVIAPQGVMLGRSLPIRTPYALKAKRYYIFSTGNWDYLFWDSSVERVKITEPIILISLNTAFSHSKYLTDIDGVISLERATNISGIFVNCWNLRSIQFTKLKVSIEIKHSPRLTNASILYMIQNEAATSAITITLHPDAYARAMADADILAALEQHTNISLASA